MCRSKRIAERKAKADGKNKIESEQDTRSAADPATGNAQNAEKGEDKSESTNEILRELQDPNLKVDDMSTCELAAQISDMLHMPEIMEEDYKDDEIFSPIYIYLKESKLTGNDDTDRKTLLLSENYFLENNLLYSVTPKSTKGKKSSK